MTVRVVVPHLAATLLALWGVRVHALSDHPATNLVPGCTACIALLLTLAAIFWHWFEAINFDPRGEVPLRDRPRPKPPELIVTSRPIPPRAGAERYYFAVTNDESVDLQNKG